MPKWSTVAIVGVGLIGGSIGLALRQKRLATRVIGIGRSQASLDEALRVGAIDQGTTEVPAGVAEADLVIVCTPVELIVPHVRRLADEVRPGTLITDAGSTKGTICQELAGAAAEPLANEARFLGSHPLAGSEKRGPGEARGDLLEGRVVVVTPLPDNQPADVHLLTELWTSLGAKVVIMSPEEHDRALAAVSHLPHLLAAALAAATPSEEWKLAAGGMRDTTRIAAADPELWTQIFLANPDNLLNSLDRFRHYMDQFESAIRLRDREQLDSLLRIAKRNRDALGS